MTSPCYECNNSGWRTRVTSRGSLVKIACRACDRIKPTWRQRLREWWMVVAGEIPPPGKPRRTSLYPGE